MLQAPFFNGLVFDLLRLHQNDVARRPERLGKLISVWKRLSPEELQRFDGDQLEPTPSPTPSLSASSNTNRALPGPALIMLRPPKVL